jgi:transcriptional regulator with XRE-family HTH domain
MGWLKDNRLCLWGSSTVVEQNKQCLLTEDLHRQLLTKTEGITQTEIADKSGVDRGTVAKILANKPDKPFHFANAEKVLEAFEVQFGQDQIVDASIGFGANVASGSIPPTPKSLPVIDSPFLTMEAEQLLSQAAGRDELLRQIFEELEKGSSRSLVGEALVGKTYLLKQICKQGQQRLTNIEDLLYLDLRMVNPGQFFPTLCVLLGVDPPLRGFELQRKLFGKKYVLCLDEIDRLTDKECFSSSDRDQLCGMCNGKDSELSLVVASQTELRVLFPDEPLRTSPLVNLCPTLDVSPISLKQVQVFVTNILNSLDVNFTHQQVKQLHEESMGRPRKLLDLAHHQYQESTKARG